MNPQVDPDWYRDTYVLDIVDAPWTEHTRREVDGLVQALNLTGHERILDLGCGFGRHALEFARRGFAVVGIDLSPDLIRLAQQQAAREALPAEFSVADLREIPFAEEFDVALNLYVGGIGFFDSDAENARAFAAIARVLKPGGASVLHLANIEHLRQRGAWHWWEEGQRMTELWQFTWDERARTLYSTSAEIRRGEVFQGLRPATYRQRVYEESELRALLSDLGMDVVRVSQEDDLMTSYEHYYITVLSVKRAR